MYELFVFYSILICLADSGNSWSRNCAILRRNVYHNTRRQAFKMTWVMLRPFPRVSQEQLGQHPPEYIQGTLAERTTNEAPKMEVTIIRNFFPPPDLQGPDRPPTCKSTRAADRKRDANNLATSCSKCLLCQKWTMLSRLQGIKVQEYENRESSGRNNSPSSPILSLACNTSLHLHLQIKYVWILW
jgi:hypothetical protein